MRKCEWELNKEIDGIRLTNTFMGPKAERLLKKQAPSHESVKRSMLGLFPSGHFNTREMSGMFYHIVIHGLGFFICFMI